MSESPDREMPRYNCHKTVHALKIKNLVHRKDGSAEMTPDDEGYAAFVLDAVFMSKHDPHIDGYYVVYDDGYKSFSPKAAFEEGYTKEKAKS